MPSYYVCRCEHRQRILRNITGTPGACRDLVLMHGNFDDDGVLRTDETVLLYSSPFFVTSKNPIERHRPARYDHKLAPVSEELFGDSSKEREFAVHQYYQELLVATIEAETAMEALKLALRHQGSLSYQFQRVFVGELFVTWRPDP